LLSTHKTQLPSWFPTPPTIHFRRPPETSRLWTLQPPCPAAIREARRKINEKPVDEQIPIVPKLDEDERSIEWQPPEEDKSKIKVVRELNVEEQERKAKLKEREKRIEEFEDLEKKLEGKTGRNS
jgi:hypothetical protein